MRLPHYYNLAFGMTVPAFVAVSSFVNFYGVGSWNLGRTVNWGLSHENYLTLIYLLAIGPAMVVLCCFVRREELRVTRVLGAVFFLIVSNYLIPAFILS